MQTSPSPPVLSVSDANFDATIRDVIVVGGGLAGLVAAVRLARAGRSVELIEAAKTLGGRAATRDESGFSFNLGPHALYTAGAARRTLIDLGIETPGGKPSIGGKALVGGALEPLPLLPAALFGRSHQSLLDRFGLVKSLVHLAVTRPSDVDDMTLAELIARVTGRPAVSRALLALARLTTYAADPRRQSAGAVLRQLRLFARGNVIYVDGGWSTLVAALSDAASEAGVTISTGTAVAAVSRDADGGAAGVRLTDGREIASTTVILTLRPEAARNVVSAEKTSIDLYTRADQVVPVRAATLDIALSELPNKEPTFVLGLDWPGYLSVHSKFASLAPDGGAVVHVAKYLGPSKGDPNVVRAELEALMDLAQPGWRDHVVSSRFLPRLTVAHDLPTAASGGIPSRKGPAVSDVPGLFVIGDWVGSEGLLADAAVASADRAAREVVALLAAAR